MATQNNNKMSFKHPLLQRRDELDAIANNTSLTLKERISALTYLYETHIGDPDERGRIMYRIRDLCR